jgi:hypothetical protein
MSSHSDLIDQSPILTPLTILPRSDMHQHSSSVSRFDAVNLTNALSSVAERLPRAQTHSSIDTGAKINEGFKNLTRNLRRDFNLRGFGGNRDSKDSSPTKDSPVDK